MTKTSTMKELTDARLEPCQLSMMEPFESIVDG